MSAQRSNLSLCPLSPVVANILQVAYYRGPLVTALECLNPAVTMSHPCWATMKPLDWMLR